MQQFRSLALLGLVAVCKATAACNADNCLRALQNTARPGLADCASYFAHVVTPSTTTFTVTATTISSTSAVVHTTLTSIEDVEATGTVLYTAAETDTAILSITDTVLAKRSASSVTTTSTPTSAATIPAYASPCTSMARYSSACSCAGFILSTATAPTPSATITVTRTVPTTVTTQVAVDTTAVIISTTDTTFVTSTVGTLTSTLTSTDITTSTSSTSVPASLPTNFALYGIAVNPGMPSITYGLGYAEGQQQGVDFNGVLSSSADIFTLTPEGYVQLLGTTHIAVAGALDLGVATVVIMDAETAEDSGLTFITCVLDEASLLLSCTEGGETMMQYCQDRWSMAQDFEVGYCMPLRLQVVYVL